MTLHKRISLLSHQLHVWHTYGCLGGWERFTHLSIAFGSIVFLVSAIILSLHTPHWLSDMTVLTLIIDQRIDPKAFAYVMAILASLIAAVCTGFAALLFDRNNPLHDPVHSLRYVTALVIALLASIAATIGFAATYAITSPYPASVAARFTFYGLLLSFIQLVISMGLVGITIIPIVNNRTDAFVKPLVMAISTVFWLPAAWLCLLLVAMPGALTTVAPALLFALSATMGQALFPHGVYLERGMEQYKAILWRFATCGCIILTLCTIFAGVFIIAAVAWPSLSDGFCRVTVSGILLAVGVAMWFYSVYIEGIRKLPKTEASTT